MAQTEIFPVVLLATHRATYFERLVRIIPRNGKEECKLGFGKQTKDTKDYLVFPSHSASKPTLDLVRQMYGEDWSFESVAAHCMGVRA